MMKRKMALAAVVLSVSFGIVGCGADTQNSVPEEENASEVSTNDKITEEHVSLSDGRVVTCVLYNGYSEAGLDCDWAGAAIPLDSSE